MKNFLRTKKWVYVAAVCIAVCAMTGCLESSFNLASESRLPQGVAIPPGLTRANVTVTLDYIGITKAKFTIRGNNGKKLAAMSGKTKGNPVYLKTIPQEADPRIDGYQIVVINGVTEILGHVPYREHDNMDQNGRRVALFYVIDDPAVRKEVLAARGMQ